VVSFAIRAVLTPLQLAKMFRYFRLPAATVDATFVIFLLSWLVTRQIGFFAVFLSCLFRAPWDLPWGWVPSEGRYVNYYTTTTFQALLAALLVMSCIWFYMACNVAYRVLRGLGAEDSRSDDE
jgi:acyl-CoA-dependent ceramide synthase